MCNRKDASKYTEELNKRFYSDGILEWEDNLDFEFAGKGLIAQIESPVIKSDSGNIVLDLTKYDFLSEEKAPSTANPSLWRQARLNTYHGLFKVVDGIYQVRGYDISVITFIEGKTGYIIIDPLTSAETARTSLELVYKHLGKKPIIGVIYTHSHVDHWGGVKGIISNEDVEERNVRIIAPEGFMKATVSEFILAGNAMHRRSMYMFGSLVPNDEKGTIDAGLGKLSKGGRATLIAPTDSISETGTKITLDGIEIIFQLTPGTEAPAEMNLYLPQFRALCMAENCTHNMHNLYTIRGAEVRDAKAWAAYINEAIELYGKKSDLVFATHHWPVWGQEKSIEYLKKQRDMYKYIHDQTLRLANHGYTMIEIAEMIKLPKSIAKEWHTRGCYGSLNHNSKAVYQRYLGFYDGNPATLNQLPPEEAGVKYVEFMGGAEAVLQKAREAFEKGEYRWVAQVVNHVVFAYPSNKDARLLQADALEQLGYQAESAPWRNAYLAGALELRQDVERDSIFDSVNIDVIMAMQIEDIFDFMSVRLNGPKADGEKIVINFDFTDISKQYILTLENSVLNYSVDARDDKADATIRITKADFNYIVLEKDGFFQKVVNNEFEIAGNNKKFEKLLSLLDDFDRGFNIVTP